MVVHRLLGESMGSASMKEAMFSRQCSIVPPAGRLFLLFKPYRTEGQTRLSNKLLEASIPPFTQSLGGDQSLCP